MTSTTPTPAAGLSPETARRLSRAATGTVVIIAVCAAVLSYSGLLHLAVIAGVDPRLALLLPLIIDGLVLAGMLGVVYATLAHLSTIYPWTLVAVGVTVSVAGNSLAAGPDLLSRVVHGLPPVVLALTAEAALTVLRHRAALPAPRTRRRQQRTTAPAAVVAGTPVPAAATAPARRRRTSTTTTSPAARPSARRDQVAVLLAEQPDITGSAVARALAIDPADGRRHLRALRAEQPAPLALVVAAAGGA